MLNELDLVAWYAEVMEKGINVMNTVQELMEEKKLTARLKKTLADKTRQYKDKLDKTREKLRATQF